MIDYAFYRAWVYAATLLWLQVNPPQWLINLVAYLFD